MQLDVTQLKKFDEEGWIILPDCFSPEEVGGLVAPTGKPGAILMFHGNLRLPLSNSDEVILDSGMHTHVRVKYE